MGFSSILLYVAIVSMCWAGEPVCRQFDYDEKMLSKMIRTEIAVETMMKRIDDLESMLRERNDRMQGPQFAELIRTSSIDGGWRGWTEWTECTSTCGAGIKTRYRSCDNPAPYLNGKTCEGLPLEVISCSLQPCHVLQPTVGPIVNAAGGDVTRRVGFTVNYPVALPDGVLAFRTVDSNYGKNFDEKTGRFTCEIPGLYFFSATIISGRAVTEACFCYITVSLAKKSLVHAHTKHTGDYPSGSGSLVYKLKKNEVVSLSGCQNAEKFDPGTHFSGVLIK